mmetsp:Transcript_17783/g.27479  ORF Transcript_17783/g.27479 Transcript_17783/m.27479 type:complete len:203 (+) Transcript_17783:70-678(+)
MIFRSIANSMLLSSSRSSLGKAVKKGSLLSSSLSLRTNVPATISSSVRWYTPMTKEEEEIEKARVVHLSPEEKDAELRELNRKISRLEMLRGINNGELYTWSGRYKVLMREYAFPLFIYYWGVWSTMGASVYLAIGLGGLDAMEVIAKFDAMTGFSLAQSVDPTLGTIGLALVLNEALEPIRLPFVVATLKPMMDTINPPKY